MPEPGDTGLRLPVLKGPAFTARLRELCADELRVRPIDGIRHRRILVPGVTGGEVQFALLGLIAQALRIRGAEVTALLCDAFLPACSLRKVDHHESACTRWCHVNSAPFARTLRLPHRWYSSLTTPGEIESARQLAARVPATVIPDVEYRGVALGEHVLRSLESFFLVGAVDLERPDVADKAREFLQSAVHLADIAFRALDELAIDKVLLEDGKKTDWGVFRAVARRRGVPVDLLPISPRGRHVMLERDRPPAAPDSMPGWPRWRDRPLMPGEQRRLDRYLDAREHRPMEGCSFGTAMRRATTEETRATIGLPRETPPGSLAFAMFPNVGYDAGLGADRPAFATAARWVEATVELFRRLPEHVLVVKVHPGERFLSTRDSSIERLRDPPGNVRIVDAGSGVTARRVIELADVALVYTSTVAVEASALGTPVILAGGGWHANRGATTDVHDPDDYLALIEGLCNGTATLPDRVDAARRYAYALFFRASLPIRFFDVDDLAVTAIDLDTIDDLAPGRDESLDLICRAVLTDELPEAPRPRPTSARRPSRRARDARAVGS